MSWVFLTDDRVFKLKKPVKYSFLDFSTLERRRFFCEEELRLNRRLAAETYLSVRPLRRALSGTFSFDGAGRIVDWVVEMRRLPQTDMLDERIRTGVIGPDGIGRIARLLAEFYAGVPPERVDADAYLSKVIEEHGINRAILMRDDLALADIATGPVAAVEELFTDRRSEILGRLAANIILEGHGDLRPEHVCLINPPQIIDCLEFNRAMRVIDPYDEVNYLGMECDMLGAPWIRPMLVSALEQRIGRRPSTDLMALYSAFRALLRARLCALLETPVRHPGKWRPLAIDYVKQAERELFSSRYPAVRKAIRRREDTR